MTPEEASKAAQDNLPNFTTIGTPERLSGGLLNFVFRVRGEHRSVIVKRAPPFVASSPTIPLSEERARFEADALSYLGNFDVRSAPKLYAFDQKSSTLIMEDLADGRSLDQSATGELGAKLGEFIADLHLRTKDHADLLTRFNNHDVQMTRLAVQYSAAGDFAKRAGCASAAQMGATAKALGERLLLPGRCLIMGDLWPSSVLITPENELRIIDWEFCHFGNPAQDVGHMSAHLWMRAHTGTNAAAACRTLFLKAYFNKVAGTDLWDEETHADASVHFGCELLTRTVGTFSAGFLYDGQSAQLVQEACQVAERAIIQGAVPDPNQ